jgi:prephenate dehydratase
MRNHKIAIQGAVASFHDIAAKKYFGEDIDTLACGSFREVCEKIKANKADYGIIAIENKIAGTILSNYQLIELYDLHIIGETYLPIELYLIAKPGTQLGDIKEIISHPMALGQCQEFLNEQEDVNVLEYKDTASSAELILNHPDNSLGIIAGPLVSETYDLEKLTGNICDEKYNFTRFYIVSKYAVVDDEPNKASINLRCSNEIGSLHTVLQIFKELGLNLSKIQSVPITNTVDEYAFHLDIEFEDKKVLEKALQNLENHTQNIRVLGIYKGEKIPVLNQSAIA